MRNWRILFSALVVFQLGGCIHQNSQETERLGRSANSEVLFANVSQLGIFDPSVAATPGASRAWMSYSAVDPSPRWPNQNSRAVTTRLAYSDDDGKTWKDSGKTINALKDVELPGWFNKSGTWHNEVSSLVYDPWGSPSARWKLFWHHYLTVNGKSRFENGWIGLKTAATPEGLSSARELKLFSAKAYNEANNDLAGASASPVANAPVLRVETLHPDLSRCVALSEPGGVATGEGIFLSVGCFEVHFLGIESKIILLKCATPCDPSVEGAWKYVATLLTDKDAGRWNADSFSGADIFEADGRHYLVVSPVTDQPVQGAYNGCLVFRFTNIGTGALDKTKAISRVSGTKHSFNGACTHQHSAAGGRFLYGEIQFGDRPTFHIFVDRTAVP